VAPRQLAHAGDRAQPAHRYEKAAQISLLAYREDLSLKDAALGDLTAEQFDKWVRPEDMTHPLTK